MCQTDGATRIQLRLLYKKHRKGRNYEKSVKYNYEYLYDSGTDSNTNK